MLVTDIYMKIRWNIEHLCFPLIREHSSLQYAFSLMKETISPDDPMGYIRKIFLLLKLWLALPHEGSPPERLWRKKRAGGPWPEWNNRDDERLAAVHQRLSQEKVLLADWDGVMVLRGSLPEEGHHPAVWLPNRVLVKALERAAGHQSVYLVFPVGKILSEEEKRWLKEVKQRLQVAGEVLLQKDGTLPKGLPQSAGRAAAGQYPDIRTLRPSVYPGYVQSPAMAFYHLLMVRRLHAEQHGFSFFYGTGYQYGGLLAVSFCQWLHELRIHRNFQGLLFCSRDGDILRKLYGKMYPEEEPVYLRVSRRAVCEVFFEEEPEEYLKRYVSGRGRSSGPRETAGQLLKDLGLDQVFRDLPAICRLREETELTPKTAEELGRALYEHRDRICRVFAPFREGGIAYLTGAAEAYRRSLVIDLGWHGSIASYLGKLADGEKTICCAVMGAAGSQRTLQLQEQQKMFACFFADDRQRPDGQYGVPLNSSQVEILELLFSSPEPTLRHYLPGRGQGEMMRPLYDGENPDRAAIREIHRGILDFAADMVPFLQEHSLTLLTSQVWQVCSELIGQKPMRRCFLRQLKAWRGKQDRFQEAADGAVETVAGTGKE